MVSSLRVWLLAALFGVALTGGACLYSEEPSTEVVAVQTGALNVQIEPGGAGVTRVSYEIRRGDKHYRAGSFMLDGVGGNFSVVLGAIESGDGYLMNLTAEVPLPDGVKKTTCNGSGDFSVMVSEITTVKLVLRCKSPLERMTVAERCPIICGIRSLPGEAPLGKRMTLKAAANLTGTLGSPLSFTWSSSGGRLVVGQTPGQAELECTEVGIPTVTVKLNNGDPTCTEDRVTLNVTCRRGPRPSRGSAGSLAADGGSGPRAGSGGSAAAQGGSPHR